MFEYLMPLLVMRDWPEHAARPRRTTRSCAAQIEYGATRGVPWGVCESAFNAKDAQLTYQYQAFGVPGLGLKRGLSDDVVVAPYASMLALPVDAARGRRQPRGLLGGGRRGPLRLLRGARLHAGPRARGPAARGGQERTSRTTRAWRSSRSATRSSTARMRERFHADPIVGSAELLLQERVPRHVQLVTPHVEEVEHVRSVRELPPPVTRSYTTADTPVPATHFLSNGRYSVMVTNGGGGYSRWNGRRGHALPRGRHARLLGHVLLRARHRDRRGLLGAAQPAPAPARRLPRRSSRPTRRSSAAPTATSRRTSRSRSRPKTTSRSAAHDHEPRLGRAHARGHVLLRDRAHGAGRRPGAQVVLEPVRRDRVAARDQRAALHAPPAQLRGAAVLGPPRARVRAAIRDCPVSYETDRAAFLGRLRGADDPAALDARRRPRRARAGRCSTRAARSAAASRCRRARACASSSRPASPTEPRDRAAPHREVPRRRAARSARSTSRGPRPSSSCATSASARRRRSRSSGSLAPRAHRPVLAAQDQDAGRERPADVGAVVDRHLAATCRSCSCASRSSSTRRSFARRCSRTSTGATRGSWPTSSSSTRGPPATPTSSTTGCACSCAPATRCSCSTSPAASSCAASTRCTPTSSTCCARSRAPRSRATAARIELQLNRRGRAPLEPDPLVVRREPSAPSATAPFERPALDFDNGFGGFDPETGEYVIVLEDGDSHARAVDRRARLAGVRLHGQRGRRRLHVGAQQPREPHHHLEQRPRHATARGEAIYVRDEETGEFWSPTPLPVRTPEPYVVRHGKGRVALRARDPRHRARARLVRARRATRCASAGCGSPTPATARGTLSATQFVEWVLGDSRSRAQQLVGHVVRRRERHAHRAQPLQPRLPRPLRVPRDATGRCTRWTASRTEFVGRNGRPCDPAAMKRKGLGGHPGRYHDNCGALHDALRARAGRDRRGQLPARPDRDARGGARAGGALPRAGRGRRRARGVRPASGATCSARCRSRRPTRSST